MPDVTIKHTPEELADLFAELDSGEQARFFNRIAEVASKWKSPFEFQLQAITDEDGFAAVNAMGGESIRVGDGTETVARRRVAGVDDLLDWLEANLLEATDSSLETPHVEP